MSLNQLGLLAIAALGATFLGDLLHWPTWLCIAWFVGFAGVSRCIDTESKGEYL